VLNVGARGFDQSEAPVIAQKLSISLPRPRFSRPLRPRRIGCDAAAASSAALNLLQENAPGRPFAAEIRRNSCSKTASCLSLLPGGDGRPAAAIDDAEFAAPTCRRRRSVARCRRAACRAPTLVPHCRWMAALQHLLAAPTPRSARQTLLQVALLPGQTDPAAGKLDPSGAAVEFRNPVRHAAGHRGGAFEISRDGGGAKWMPSGGLAGAILTRHRAFRPDPCDGLAERRANVSGGCGRSGPRPHRNCAQALRKLSQALSRAELQPGDIVVRDGAPAQPASAPAGRFLDRAL